MTIVKEAIQATRDLIADEKCWTKSAYARDAYSKRVSPRFEGAVSWCVAGALAKVMDGYDADDHRSVWVFIAAYLDKGETAGSATSITLTTINDHRGHDAVIEMLDGMLVKLGEEEEA